MTIDERSLPQSFIKLFGSAKSHRIDTLGQKHIEDCVAFEDSAANEIKYSDDVTETFKRQSEQCGCCEGEKCDLCIQDIKNVSVLKKEDKIHSKYRGVAKLLLATKLDQYKSQLENPYLPLGDKIFLMDAQGDPVITDDVVEKAAIDVSQSFNTIVSENEITVDELPEVIPFNTARSLFNAVGTEVTSAVRDELTRGLNDEQDAMLKIVSVTNLSSKYLDCLTDMFYYSVFGLWTDEQASVELEDKSSGKLEYKTETVPWVYKIDPKYFWYTPSFFDGNIDKAAFRMERMSEGQLIALKDKTTSQSLRLNIEEFLEDNSESGYCNPCSLIYQHSAYFEQGVYEILIGRGYFDIEELKIYDSNLVETMLKEYENEVFLPVEIWYGAGKILNIKAISKISKNLGVYVSTFRGSPLKTLGTPLWKYLEPPVYSYENAFIALDKDAAALQGRIVLVDKASGVNITVLGETNGDGVSEIDYTKDIVINWDSALVDNTRTSPIQAITLDSIASQAILIMQTALSQIPVITGIDELLTSGDNVSSALRTNDVFNEALDNSKNSIKSILRTPDKVILNPVLNFFFKYRQKKGLTPQIVMENDIKILTLDEINAKYVDGRNKLRDTGELYQFGSDIPTSTRQELINQLAKETYNVEGDLIRGTSPLTNNAASIAPGEI